MLGHSSPVINPVTEEVLLATSGSLYIIVLTWEAPEVLCDFVGAFPVTRIAQNHLNTGLTEHPIMRSMVEGMQFG